MNTVALLPSVGERGASSEDERFNNDAANYARYLETPEGRLRLDLAFAHLQEFLPNTAGSLLALDVGGGTGATAVRLAQLGVHVTLLDASLAMLEIAERAAREAGIAQRIAFKHGDAAQLASLFAGGAFDVVVCHNILEYIDDPGAILGSAVRMLRNAASVISVLVRNQAGEVLKTAIQNGDLVATDRNLTAEWGKESLYGGKVRLFTAATARAMLEGASLTVISTRGVRVVSDYLPPKISRSDEYERILGLERKLGCRPEFAAVARYTHCLAHRATPRL